MIFGDFRKALGQIGDPRFRRVLGLGIGLAIALLFAIYAAFLLAIQSFAPDVADLPLIGPVSGVQTFLGWASLIFMTVLSVFLMIPVAAAFSGLFLDDVAAAVEARHYPFLPPPIRPQRGAALIETANLLGLMLAVNLAGLLLLPVTGPFYILVFWALNGFLLGREYFAMAAMRRLPRDQARAMRRRNFLTIWAAGILMALGLSLPLANLLVPVLGAATFTHLYHRLAASGR